MANSHKLTTIGMVKRILGDVKEIATMIAIASLVTFVFRDEPPGLTSPDVMGHLTVAGTTVFFRM